MRQPGTHMCPHIWAGGSHGGLAQDAGFSPSPLFPMDLNLGLSGSVFLSPSVFPAAQARPSLPLLAGLQRQASEPL